MVVADVLPVLSLVDRYAKKYVPLQNLIGLNTKEEEVNRKNGERCTMMKTIYWWSQELIFLPESAPIYICLSPPKIVKTEELLPEL